MFSSYEVKLYKLHKLTFDDLKHRPKPARFCPYKMLVTVLKEETKSKVKEPMKGCSQERERHLRRTEMFEKSL